MNERDWIKATHSSYGDNPSEYNGPDLDNCKICDMEPKAHDTDLCDGCIDNMDEGKEISNCCSDTLQTDMGLCYGCKDHASSATEEALEDTDICIPHYRHDCKICEANNIELQKHIEDAENL